MLASTLFLGTYSHNPLCIVTGVCTALVAEYYQRPHRTIKKQRTMVPRCLHSHSMSSNTQSWRRCWPFWSETDSTLLLRSYALNQWCIVTGMCAARITDYYQKPNRTISNKEWWYTDIFIAIECLQIYNIGEGIGHFCQNQPSF